MAINYTALADEARQIIEENGRSVTVVKHAESSADSNKPWRERASSNDTEVSAIAVLVPYEAQDMDGSVLRRGDMRCLLAAASAEVAGQDIETFDVLRDGETGEWRIVNVKVIQPGPTRVVYDIQLRQ